MVALAELHMDVTSGPYQGLAALDAWIYEDLKNDIVANGIIVPIVVTQDGVIVDGHHRYKIAVELGIVDSLPVEVRTYHSEAAIQAEAIGLNALRRQMSKDERNRQIVRLREAGMTQAQVAERLDLSRRRVAQVEDEEVAVTATSSSDQPPKKRGGKYATKADSEKVQAKVAEMVADGASTREIADELDISMSAAWQRKKRLPAGEPPTPLHEQIADCASRGMTSPQIASEVGKGAEWVREQARRHSIDIPADRASHKKRIDADAAMGRAIEQLEGAIYPFQFIPMSELDRDQIDEWSRSLNEISKSIRTLIRQLNQPTKEQDQS